MFISNNVNIFYVFCPQRYKTFIFSALWFFEGESLVDLFFSFDGGLYLIK